ncbi:MULTISPECIES: phosphate ABC transporter permease subunit PstC [unclassified Thermoactinomyces]|jgi:phosphate transport system permease protein|nr:MULTISPECIES: phosphate ABC transporter permease subunit PstC [unclassified Thermoactinomyces]MBH8603912.1 phosphate ABC transporter permease subunit PstC [Thermoactinomyces sp. CICC 10522]MBH8606555.1 phosphate ABC transporter permease subunit PstC [Thermoactinomyces sp. CICC 10521]
MEQAAVRVSSMEKELTKPNQKWTRIEYRGKVMTLVSAWVLIITLFSLLYFIASKGIAPFLHGEVTLADFFSGNWGPSLSAEQGGPQYGALDFILGSLMVALGSAVISGPLGIGAALFMTEIAPKAGRKILQPAVEILVGIPSVVYGFIGLTLIVPALRSIFGEVGFGLLAGIIVLSVMILPTIISISADAIHSVPQGIREGSYALGATRWQTISGLVIRVAQPGLLTAVVLGIARAFGEALAVQMVIGNTADLPFHLLKPMSTLTSVITLNMGNTVQGSTYNNVLWSMALILLLMTLILILAIRFIARRREV